MTESFLREQFSGMIIEPGDSNYEAASTVMMRKGAPALIAMAQSPQDVAAALAYAQSNNLLIAVRSGGHSNAGLSTNDGGIIIDVSCMNSIELMDQASGRVRIGAGAQWGDIARRLYDWKLALSSGDTKTVGASGLMLGGGIGWMVRKYGLALDSLMCAEIVTADGRILIADEENNADLFWAIRGGGGNFGIVTGMECIAHPVDDILYGSIVYDPADAPAIVGAWRDYMRTAPDELTTSLLIMPANMMGEHPTTCMVQCCWAGTDAETANAALAPLRAIGKVLSDDITRVPYYQVLEEAHPPQGMRIETNNAFFNELTDEKVEDILTACFEDKRIIQMRGLGGAMGRVSVDATAFAHRNAEVMVLLPTFMPSSVTEAEVETALEPWHRVANGSNGSYVNFLSQVTERERNAAYPPATLARLAEIKAVYDPTNIFNQNLNIPPQI
jgi:FAD/FMN-containing dehydrogenase